MLWPSRKFRLSHWTVVMHRFRISWLLLALPLAAPALAAGLPALGAGLPTPPKRLVEPPLTPQDRRHWAFQKPVRPPSPTVRHASWIRTPVDAFIMSRLENAGLEPSPPADKTTLLRRLTFDLTGLPPTPDELDSFLHYAGPDAYVRAVDRLLASPHYGERWAQHWLDVVRYAETNGYEADGERPHAWRYRDYVVRAFNDDKPYNRFLVEQLAGDELARGQEARQMADLLVATGFNRCGPIHLTSGNVDKDVLRQEQLTEMTTGVAAAFLGLTMGCARCHDHKFDPISQADYYRLQSFFAATQPRDVDIAAGTEHTTHDAAVAVLNAQTAPLAQKVAALDAPHQARLTKAKTSKLSPEFRQALEVPPAKRTAEQRKLAGQAEILIKVTWDEILDDLTPAERAQRAAWRGQIHALEAQMPPPIAHAWAISDGQDIPATYVLRRGDPKHREALVHPAFPRVLTETPSPTTSPPLDRLALARWLTAPDHPLTARVLVNRIWQHHFGRGLVATPNDFGLRGELPTHPELLDWLACEFVEHGWSIKHLHRLIVLSSTYQQASRVPDSHPGQRLDPDNRLLWHANRHRLEGESLRDAILAVSGGLNRKLGGPMVRVPLEPEVYELIFTEGERDGLWPVTPDVREHGRRSLYLFAKRNVRLPVLEAFDRPDTLTSCPVRPVSTFAPQALILMNGPLLQEQSKRFATRLIRECGTDLDRQIDHAYRLALARPPRPVEIRMARAFLTEQQELVLDRLRARQRVGVPPDLPESADPAAAAALADFCLALLNRNEFVYVP
jgi:hypothetical protein